MSRPSSPYTHDERPADKPLTNVSIYVSMEAKRKEPNAGTHADRIAKHLKGELERAVAAAAPTGVRSQFVAVQEVIKSASLKIDPGTIVGIRVYVRGDCDDAKHYREYHASPPLPTAG